MKRILVTGGTGFIGSHTCLVLLEKGYEIIVIDSLINSSIISLEKVCQILNLEDSLNREKVFFFKGDLRDKEFIETVFFESKKVGKPIEGVLHFAALKAVKDSLNNPLRYWDVNVKGSINLLNVMDKNNCRTIVFSSSATIYESSNGELIDESSLIKPSNPYGSTKFVIEHLLNEIINSKPDKWRIINLRYFNPIGAHTSGLIGECPVGKPSNIFPAMIRAASGQSNQLDIYGKDWPTYDGTCIRDFIHVMDLADGHVAALNYLENNKPQLKNFNLGTGIGTSVLELLFTFQKVNKLEIPHHFLPRREGDLMKVVADNSFAVENLNWKPRKNLEDMCRDGWNWQLQNPKGFKK